MGSEKHIKLECLDCHFTQIISPTDERSPADVIVEHGRRTGHTITPITIED